MTNANRLDHGTQRVLERRGIKLEDAQAFIARVWKNGKTMDTYSGKIRKELERRATKDGDNRTIRVFGGECYIFMLDGTLVTTLDFKYKIDKQKKLPRYHEIDDYDFAS